MRLVRWRSAARCTMSAFWVEELDTAVTSDLGYRAATYRHRLPHPHPTSRTCCPSSSCARWQ